jgi:hypothetical protein
MYVISWFISVKYFGNTDGGLPIADLIASGFIFSLPTHSFALI